MTTTDLASVKRKLRRDYDPYATGVTIQEHLDNIAERRESVPFSWSAAGGGAWIATTYDESPRCSAEADAGSSATRTSHRPTC